MMQQNRVSQRYSGKGMRDPEFQKWGRCLSWLLRDRGKRKEFFGQNKEPGKEPVLLKLLPTGEPLLW